MGGKQSSESKSDQGEGPTLSETHYRPDDSPVVIPDSLQPSFSTTLPPPPPHHRPLPPPPQPSPPHHMHRPSPSPPLSQRYRPSASNNDLPRPRFGSAGPHHHHHRHRQPAAPDLLDWDFLLTDFPRPPPPRPPPPPSHRTHRSSSASSSTDRERRRRRAELREQLGAASAGSRLDPFTLLLRGLGRSDSECPMCHEEVPSGDFQRHLSECARRPKLQYNEDVLRISSGECSICLEDMSPGDTIARLPCLCVYHVKCIDEWFRVKQTCPEHPDLSHDDCT